MNIASAQPDSRLASVLYAIAHPLQTCCHRFGVRTAHQWAHPVAAAPTMYQIADRLHQQHTVRVPGDEIANTVSAWLAELEVHSPMAEELARAVCTGNWPAAYSICEHLSINITVAN